jgi:hypothetical protein
MQRGKSLEFAERLAQVVGARILNSPNVGPN